jgi:hypothetical protein
MITVTTINAYLVKSALNHVMKRFCILYADSNKITCNSIIGVITSYKNILQLNQSDSLNLDYLMLLFC